MAPMDWGKGNLCLLEVGSLCLRRDIVRAVVTMLGKYLMASKFSYLLYPSK